MPSYEDGETPYNDETGTIDQSYNALDVCTRGFLAYLRQKAAERVGRF